MVKRNLHCIIYFIRDRVSQEITLKGLLTKSAHFLFEYLPCLTNGQKTNLEIKSRFSSTVDSCGEQDAERSSTLIKGNAMRRLKYRKSDIELHHLQFQLRALEHIRHHMNPQQHIKDWKGILDGSRTTAIKKLKSLIRTLTGQVQRSTPRPHESTNGTLDMCLK